MEKVIMYRLYYFEDDSIKYYYENSSEAEMARFVHYKKYDYQRLTIRNYKVPVSRVKSILVNEDSLKYYEISHFDNKKESNSKEK